MRDDLNIKSYLTLDDFFKAEKKNIDAKAMCFNYDTGVLTIHRHDGSKDTLCREDFVNRHLYPVYNIVDGKYVIDHYEENISLKKEFSNFEITGGITA